MGGTPLPYPGWTIGGKKRRAAQHTSHITTVLDWIVRYVTHFHWYTPSKMYTAALERKRKKSNLAEQHTLFPSQVDE